MKKEKNPRRTKKPQTTDPKSEELAMPHAKYYFVLR